MLILTLSNKLLGQGRIETLLTSSTKDSKMSSLSNQRLIPTSEDRDNQGLFPDLDKTLEQTQEILGTPE
jgi:hypothetical protein